jgi:hypothetical protein
VTGEHQDERRGSGAPSSRWRPDAALLAVLALAFILVARLGIGVISTAAEGADARHYVAVGMTVARDGVFGFSADAPTMYREPLTSWTIALQATIDPRLRGLTFEDVDGEGAAARAVKQQNLLWAALTLVGVGQLALLMLGARGRRETLVALLAMLVTHVAFLEWEDVVDRSLSELAAAALLVWATYAALKALDRPRRRSWLLLGVLLGLLALTKASLLYVAVVFIPVLMLLRSSRADAPRGTLLRDAAITVVGLSLVCAPWMGRNLQQFGSFEIADRGGLAIWFRVLWNDATPDELRGAWVYFAPLPMQPAAGKLLGVDLNDFVGEGDLRRVARFAPEDEVEQRSFYRVARSDRVALVSQYIEDGELGWRAGHLADRELMRRGLEALRDDPSPFLRTFPLFLWRGTWSMLYSNLAPSFLLGPLNLAGMALLMVALALSVVFRRPRWFALVGMAGGMVAFYALLSHFEPRQSRPAVPIMLLLCVLAADRIVQSLRRRRTVSAGRPD